MVKTLAYLGFFLLAACSGMNGMDVKYDYPAADAKSKSNIVFGKKPVQLASVPDLFSTDGFFHDNKEADKTPAAENNKGALTSGITGDSWPIKDAGKYLMEYNVGQTAQAVDSKTGNNILFAIISQYSSAADHPCKRYSAGEVLYLACYSGEWYQVRNFEE